MTDKKWLNKFYEMNPDLKPKVYVSGTDAIMVLGFTNTSQLQPYVRDGHIRVTPYARGSSRVMYHIKDIIELWSKRVQIGKVKIEEAAT